MAYVTQIRPGSAPWRVTLGVHGEIIAAAARMRTDAAIARIKDGVSQAAGWPTVANLAEHDLSDHVTVPRLLMLTGCQLNEILTMRCDDVDQASSGFRLRDGKTDARMVPFAPTTEAVFAVIPRMLDSPWVIAGRTPAHAGVAAHEPHHRVVPHARTDRAGARLRPRPSYPLRPGPTEQLRSAFSAIPPLTEQHYAGAC